MFEIQVRVGGDNDHDDTTMIWQTDLDLRIISLMSSLSINRRRKFTVCTIYAFDMVADLKAAIDFDFVRVIQISSFCFPNSPGLFEPSPKVQRIRDCTVVAWERNKTGMKFVSLLSCRGGLVVRVSDLTVNNIIFSLQLSVFQFSNNRTDFRKY